jgi:hypothetical protein
VDALKGAVALALIALMLSACGGSRSSSAKAEDTLRLYLNTVPRAHPGGFPAGAGPPHVKENSCRKIGEPALWSCVVRFAHTPFHVRFALKDNGKVAWARLMPRHVLRPGTATVYQGGPKQSKP